MILIREIAGLICLRVEKFHFESKILGLRLYFMHIKAILILNRDGFIFIIYCLLFRLLTCRNFNYTDNKIDTFSLSASIALSIVPYVEVLFREIDVIDSNERWAAGTCAIARSFWFAECLNLAFPLRLTNILSHHEVGKNELATTGVVIDLRFMWQSYRSIFPHILKFNLPKLFESLPFCLIGSYN